MTSLKIIAFICSALISFGQAIPYKFSDNIIQRLSSDSLYQNASIDLSFIGEYEAALKTWDKQELKALANLTQVQVNFFSKFKPVNAKDFIVQKAKTEKIIIINEAHQQPYHRVFTSSLLADLFKEGYKYFCAETISNLKRTVTELNEKKYPTIKTGLYTKEPCYGNLVREALQIGFEVVAYESSEGFLDPTRREWEQAKNIKKIVEKDSIAKIIIHCGWDHIVEAPFPGLGKAMAGHLYELTGINPRKAPVRPAVYLCSLPLWNTRSNAAGRRIPWCA